MAVLNGQTRSNQSLLLPRPPRWQASAYGPRSKKLGNHNRYANRAGKSIRSIDKKTLDLLRSYDWPGNIRELQNVIERSVILSSGDFFSVDELWLSKET